MSPDDVRHGTTAGYYAHQRDREDVCLPCLEARREYLRVNRELHSKKAVKLPTDSRRVCTTCSAARTKHQSGICAECRSGTDEIALKGGAWVPGRHGVLHWVEGWSPQAQEEGLPVSQGERTTTAKSLTACPTCEARVDETCRTTGGYKAKRAHAGRLVGRFCPCGEFAAYNCMTCIPCGRESRRETLRAASRNYRLRHRVAA